MLDFKHIYERMNSNNSIKSMSKKVDKSNKKLEEILEFAKKRLGEGKDYLSEAETLKLLKRLPDNQIRMIRQIVNIISFKASSEGIKNSADLLSKYIQTITNEIIVPYSHFPNDFEIFKINSIVNMLVDDFEVLHSARFLADSVSVRFPVYNNDGFKILERILNSKYKNIVHSKKTSDITLEKISLSISKKNGIVIDETHSYPARGQRFEIIKFLKDSPKSGKILSDTQGRTLKETIKEIGEINRLFKNKLKVKHKLIIKIPTGGYELNRKNFDITFLD